MKMSAMPGAVRFMAPNWQTGTPAPASAIAGKSKPVMLNLSLSGHDPDLNRAVNTTEIPQCSRLFTTPSWCYPFG
jgi:hypothetical protein